MSALSPYPGLRPFTEEESIFFKGREVQVERMVKRLEEKKFLMVNGASGDGKSSLVFAGLIPYAKAGFFKAKYNQWLVADFRPERTPLHNLSVSLNKKLGLSDVEQTRKELSFGFSALIDLYKNSPYYIDEQGKDWLEADETQRKAMRRKGANLLILADQFEEFFTNPENYHKGNPSIESQQTVNILLESFRIAQEQNLPVYVVCTMRSDYIGQCAAFRGLPEAIGYSQFFVPRLKRQELEQVIEGPAQLAGGKVNKRLVQILINNLTEGFDQLPILQHALNRMWRLAEGGKSELDLLHLAMAGGMEGRFLPSGQKETFSSWLELQPSYRKELLRKPSLRNVLNAHANELMHESANYAKDRHGDALTSAETARFIEQTFRCLTKVDASRAVRNRMTLNEIAGIIGLDADGKRKLAYTLNIFREQGNTLIQPFIETGTERNELEGETVLDITHESLIRNWDLLHEWAEKENDSLNTYLDLRKQMMRWRANEFNAAFLLPLGTLNVFEDWFNLRKPNKFWLERYRNDVPSKELGDISTEDELNLLKKFIQSGARKHLLSRVIMKHGKTIARVAFTLIIVSAITYYVFDYRYKQNSTVLERMLKRGDKALASGDVEFNTKADFLIWQDRLLMQDGKEAAFRPALEKLNNDSLAFLTVAAMLEKLNYMKEDDSLYYCFDAEYINRVLKYGYEIFARSFEKQLASLKTKDVQKAGKNHYMHVFMRHCSVVKYRFPENPQTRSIVQQTANIARKALKENLSYSDYKKNGLYQGRFAGFLYSLLAIDDEPDYDFIKPLFSNGSKRLRETVDWNFSININGSIIQHEGYYELLLLTHCSELSKNPQAINEILPLIDSAMLATEKDYNIQNICGAVMKFSKNVARDLDLVINRYMSNDLKIANDNKFNRLKNVILTAAFCNSTNLISSSPDITFPIYSVPEKNISEAWNLLLSYAGESKAENAAIQKADIFKLMAFYYADIVQDKALAKDCMVKSMDIFEAFIKPFNLGNNNVNHELSPELKKDIQQYLNFFPVATLQWFDVRKSGTLTNFIVLINQNHSIFWDFIQSQGKEYLYLNPLGIDLLENFTGYGTDAMTRDVMDFLRKHRRELPFLRNQTFILLHLDSVISHSSFKDTLLAQKLLDEIEPFNNSDLMKEYIREIAFGFAKAGFPEISKKFFNFHRRVVENQIPLYIAVKLIREEHAEQVLFYLNDVFESKKFRKIPSASTYYRCLGRAGGSSVERFALNMMSMESDILKPRAMENFITGVAETGRLYRAYSFIPDYHSPDNKIRLINKILETELLRRARRTPDNSRFGKWNDSEFFVVIANPFFEMKNLTKQ